MIISKLSSNLAKGETSVKEKLEQVCLNFKPNLLEYKLFTLLTRLNELIVHLCSAF
jgi:hypothetical protein